jgi:hypothetical protein
MPDDNEEFEDGPVTISAKDLKALRSIAKDFNEIKSQSEQAQRELAFAKAKLDITDPKMSYFVKGYEGDLDPSKIREAAIAAGFIGSNSPQQTVPVEELGGHQALNEAASGGDQKREDLEEKIRNAKNSEEIMALMTAAGYPTSWNRP